MFHYDDQFFQYLFIYLLPFIFLITSFVIVTITFFKNKTFKAKLDVLSHIIYFNVFYTLMMSGISVTAKQDLFNNQLSRGEIYLLIGIFGYIFQLSVLLFLISKKMKQKRLSRH